MNAVSEAVGERVTVCQIYSDRWVSIQVYTSVKIFTPNDNFVLTAYCTFWREEEI